eukprot:CAMPEP_0176106872 /NCGR_PEP_ID=MMETSP0120_2-20121206/53631_1 /TAXON_ID=160619 /ORGANISM="Kryptoperidinium foliaceum, Strain CCMP 1326" /LENGTH=81 /DNA_ID=CAMNT_0017440995 /DNA_START=322 /DNA_END=563 /DNA_ORIENTATION=+
MVHAGVVQVVAEDVLRQEADHGVAEDRGARALERALPSHDRGPAVASDDLREDGQIHADATPRRSQPEDDHQAHVVGEGLP